MLFNELTDEQQDKAIDKLWSDEGYWYMVNDMLREDTEEEFKTVCEDASDFEYDYNYRTGGEEGFVFTGVINYSNIDDFPFANLVKDKDGIQITFSRSRDSMYCEIDVDIDCDGEGDVDAYTDEEYDKLVDAVENWYHNICDTMFNYVSDYVDGCYDKEYFSDFAMANEYQFDEDGNWL